MSKVTSKYEVTIPKRIADTYAIHPGDEIEWVAAGEVIHLVPPRARVLAPDRESSLRLFDQATERQRARSVTPRQEHPRDRGWGREDLYGP
jgi:AbrB family looped-hinge helix DNA binding protein